MSSIFVDTSGWACLFHAKLEQHEQASAIYKRIHQSKNQLVTTNYVLTELVSLLHSPLRLPRTQLIGIVGSLRASRLVQLVHVTSELDERAYDLLETRADKD
jgi:uncharacterized protein